MYVSELRDVLEAAEQLLDELDGGDPDLDVLYGLAESIAETTSEALAEIEDEDGNGEGDGDGGGEDEEEGDEDGDDA